MENEMFVVTARGLVSESWVEVIETRNAKLVEADKLVNIAMDIGQDPLPFRSYRQALRDIPQTYDNPDDVVWPLKPTI